MITTHSNMSIQDLHKLIEGLPALVQKGNPARAILMRAAQALKARIHTACVIKARGGVDEAGEHWVPLSPAYVAYKRAKRTKTEKGRASYPSQALTESQRKRWWGIYFKVKDKAIKGGSKTAHGDAAKTAWNILKREGATTLFQKYKGAQVEILRDTGLLLNSLSPAIKSSKHSILRVERNAIEVGTNRPGASAHHHGNPRMGLPQRRLWPAVANWPSSWWIDITEQIQQGIVDLIVQRLKS